MTNQAGDSKKTKQEILYRVRDMTANSQASVDVEKAVKFATAVLKTAAKKHGMTFEELIEALEVVKVSHDSRQSPAKASATLREFSKHNFQSGGALGVFTSGHILREPAFIVDRIVKEAEKKIPKGDLELPPVNLIKGLINGVDGGD